MSGILALALLFAPIRVACVGDSITEGRGGLNNFPSQLQEMLGSGYDVRNFGRTSATVMPGRLQYRRLDEFRKAIEFKPDRVLIMLGTNDSPGAAWEGLREAFRSAYQDLVTVFQRVESRPQVVVILPPPMFFPEDDWRPKNLAQQIIPLIDSIALAHKLKTYSAYKLFQDKPDLFPDKLHPSNLGFKVLACLLYTSPSPRDGLLSRMPSSA